MATRYKTALVIGGAECVWDDVERAVNLFEPDAVCAVKSMIFKWPGEINYAVTLHDRKTTDAWPGLVEAVHRRRQLGYPGTFQVWAHKHMKGADRWTPDWGGSSGLFAVKVLRLEGYERIVVAGVPMEREGGHFIRKRPWPNADFHRNGWKRHRDAISPFVRSMSGWTRKLLGEPTPEWLNELPVGAEEKGQCPS